MTKCLYGKCPLATAQQVLKGKWAILILHHISQGPIRFNELQRQMPKMTHATLSKQLKALEENDLIIRHEYPQVPPKVEYELSDQGQEFRQVLDALKVWGNQYISYEKSLGKMS